jgi:hypothetical protein
MSRYVEQAQSMAGEASKPIEVVMKPFAIAGITGKIIELLDRETHKVTYASLPGTVAKTILLETRVTRSD